MKTAISIPDNIFQAAEQYAKTHGLSRSSLYAKAVAQFLKQHARDHITQKLNEIYADQDSALNETITALQFNSLKQEKWE